MGHDQPKGRGWPAAGSFISRSGPGEGFLATPESALVLPGVRGGRENSPGGVVMFKTGLMVASVVFLAGLKSISAQDVSVSPSNRTVEVTVTETVKADPEVAIITIGYHNYGRTEDAAFANNARIANHITQSLMDAGIPKEDIETAEVKLGPPEPEEKWTAALREERRFEATQSWIVRARIEHAQSILSLAVKSGANVVEGVDWQVTDPAGLEAKANAAALAKARKLADQILSGLGSKVGNLLYASNKPRIQIERYAFQAKPAPLRAGPQQPEVKLFPKKVEEEATIHAIFAIE